MHVHVARAAGQETRTRTNGTDGGSSHHREETGGSEVAVRLGIDARWEGVRSAAIYSVVGMTSLTSIASLFLAGLFVWLGTMNWVALIAQQLRPRAPSWIPLMAGIAGALAIGLAPLQAIRHYWWVAFTLDGGSLPGFLTTAVRHLRQRGE